MRIQPLDEELIRKNGWKDSYISGYSEKIHIFHHYAGRNNKNVIVLHTPVTAAKNCYECFEQLGRIYNFNVFSVDYAPGEGECSGESKEFTLPNMVSNLDALYEYVLENYSDDIHLLGYTGAGAIMAQYYLGTSRKFKSFSQFACGIYGDITPLGISNSFAGIALASLKLLTKIMPNLSIPFSPPPAKGYHSELDNEFYETIVVRDPNFFDLKLNTTLRTLECMAGKESLLKTPISCPTLVFKTLHDRYFPVDYFDRYYSHLSCEKRLVEIDDIHNSYFINPDPFMKEIANWINAH